MGTGDRISRASARPVRQHDAWLSPVQASRPFQTLGMRHEIMPRRVGLKLGSMRPQSAHGFHLYADPIPELPMGVEIRAGTWVLK